MIIVAMLTFICVGAVVFKRNIEKMIPLCLGVIMLCTYFMAITNHLSRSVLISGLALFALSAVFSVWYFRISDINLSGFAIEIFKSFLSPGLIVFVILSIITSICMSTHFVTNWDDFNYWANFPKNIYFKDAMVSGGNVCSAYKDYLPIVQLLYYDVFKVLGGFNESYMFITNNLIILVYLIPFFEKKQESKVGYLFKCIVGLLLVPSLSFQNLHCLGVDIIIAVIFGYLLYLLFFDIKDVFFYIQVAVALSVLVLVKNSAILAVFIFVAVMVAYLWEDKIQRLLPLPLLIFPGLLYISWNRFCLVNGNVSYLSQRANESVVSGSFLNLPDYTGTVIVRFIKELFFLSLNGGKAGASAVFAMVFSFVLLMAYAEKRDPSLKRAVIVLYAGNLIYTLFLLYTYLFVFDKWEALSLSSFDRYISVFIVGMVYIALYVLMICINFDIKKTLVLIVFLMLTLNFSFLSEQLLPDNYAKTNEDISSRRAEVQNQIDEFASKQGDLLNSRILIINKEEDDELEKYQQYQMVPAVTYIMHLDYSGSESDMEQIRESAQDHRLDYVIVYDTGEVISLK